MTTRPQVVRSKCWIDYRYALVFTRENELIHHGNMRNIPLVTRKALAEKLVAEAQRMFESIAEEAEERGDSNGPQRLAISDKAISA